MRLFGRRGGAAPAVAERPASLTCSDAELWDEIERVTGRVRVHGGLEDQRELLKLRNEAGIRRLHAASPSAAFPAPETLSDADGLPQFSSDRVTPALLRGAIRRDGCMLIRGLVDRDRAIRLAEQIDRSFRERNRHDDGQRHDAHLYNEFTPDPRFGEELGRPWIKAGGGVLAVDSPQLSFELIELLGSVGLLELVEGYLGEPPLITAEKTTLRKAEPSVAGGWHQDGKFMGPVRALNLWLSLSRCGDVAPGLDIVPRRIDGLVTTATDEAPLDYVASQRVAEQAAGDTPIQRPIFEPGDALLFDELFLHKTGSDPSMPNPRYAIENWFFGGSGFPPKYAPIAV